MKKLLLIALMSSAVSGAFARKVKFSVDMKNQTVSSNGVHVAGNFQSWSPSTTTLTQEGSTTIYSVIADVTDASVVEFKFINGNDWPQAESVPSISRKSTNTNGGDGNDNRWYYVGAGSDTLMLPAFMFGGAAPDGQYAVRFVVDLAKEASVSADGVSMAGAMQDWKPENGAMANLYSSNKLYEKIYTMADGTYGYKFLNGNAWGKDESVPSACATDNNRTVTVKGADMEVSKVCYGSCDACPAAPIPKYKVTFQVDMASECNVEDVDIAGGKINGWSGGTMLSNQSGLSGDWKITKIGVGPSKGDISWFNENINSSTRPCSVDDRIVMNRDGSFLNVFGKETWVEGWQKVGANGCGAPVAPFDGSTAGTWKDNGNGTFTVYGKGSYVGIPKVVNGAEISKNEDARDSITYEYSISGTKLTTYISIGSGYWQFEYDRNTSKSTVWTTTVVLDSGVEIAHKFRKIKGANTDWEGGTDRKIFAHSDTVLAARCFGKDEPCGTSVPPSDVTFRVNMGDEIVADKIYVIGTMTSPQWQAGAIEMVESTTEADVYEAKVTGVCPDVIEYKFYNGDVNNEANGEKFEDSTNRDCVSPNGLGAFNRKLTRTSADAITVYWVYSTCRLGETAGVSSLNNEVKISPNPAVGKFNITLAGSKVNEVSILSIDGRVVRNFKTNEVSYDVNVSGLTGVYFVNIKDSLGRTAVKKIVLQ